MSADTNTQKSKHKILNGLDEQLVQIKSDPLFICESRNSWSNKMYRSSTPDKCIMIKRWELLGTPESSVVIKSRTPFKRWHLRFWLALVMNQCWYKADWTTYLLQLNSWHTHTRVYSAFAASILSQSCFFTPLQSPHAPFCTESFNNPAHEPGLETCKLSNLLSSCQTQMLSRFRYSQLSLQWCNRTVTHLCPQRLLRVWVYRTLCFHQWGRGRWYIIKIV